MSIGVRGEYGGEDEYGDEGEREDEDEELLGGDWGEMTAGGGATVNE